ncbi:MAG: hypothetical protein ACTS47_02060 [Candidatus Hodgkinia cicadicola]
MPEVAKMFVGLLRPKGEVVKVCDGRTAAEPFAITASHFDWRQQRYRVMLGRPRERFGLNIGRWTRVQGSQKSFAVRFASYDRGDRS